MTAAKLAERLQGRRSGAGWIARCPAHEDRSPSLSISENHGRVLIHCFAGCGAEAICSALGIRLRDLFLYQGEYEPKPRTVLGAERQVANLRGRLTPRERVLPVTVVYCQTENLDAGLARALALAVEGDLVQALLEDHA